MEEENIIKAEDAELYINGKKYYKLDNYFDGTKGFIALIANRLKDNVALIERMLSRSSAFIEVVKSSIPKEYYQPLFTSEQAKKLAFGSVKLMTNDEGKTFATLVNTKTNKIVGNIGLEKVKLATDLSTSLYNFNTQLELAKIAEEIEYVAIAIEEVRKGQENDRLAIAYSCKQKLLQALSISDPEVKRQVLINLAFSAEDSRNLLMLSQKEHIDFFKKQPQGFWGKLFNGEKNAKIDERFSELRESMNALNAVSLIETLAYREMGEVNAANIALKYYGNYLNDVYLSNPDLLERLDSLNPSNQRYWSTILPDISKRIEKLENKNDIKLLEDINEKK